jgi:hypothetical protein
MNIETSIGKARIAVDSVYTGLLSLINSINKDLISDLRDILDSTSQTLHKAEWYALSPSVLTSLQPGLPEDVYKKLDSNLSNLQLRIYGRLEFLDSLKVCLLPDQVASFGISIADASINPLYSETADDISKLLQQVGSILQEVNNDLIPKLGDVLIALGASVGLLAASTAPTTLPVLAISKAILEVLILLEDNLKVTKGGLLDIEFKLPRGRKSIDLPLGIGEITVLRDGELINQSIEVPDREIDLFPFLDNSKDLKRYSQSVDILLDSLNALNTVEKTKQLDSRLKEFFADLANENAKSIIKVSSDIELLAKSINEAYNSMLVFDQKLISFGERLPISRATVSNVLSTLMASLAGLRTSLIDDLTGLVEVLDTYSISSLIDVLYQASHTVGIAGTSLDDGYPLGSPGKTDLVNKWHDAVVALLRIVPPASLVAKALNPVFSLIIVLHGLVFVYSMTLLAR